MANYFVTSLPSSGIVPWFVSLGQFLELYELTATNRDFNAPDDGSRPADSSAATITASALLLLSRIEQSLSPANTSGAELRKDFAIEVRVVCL